MTATLSVALCTFNAGAYLQPQLQSIASQTRPPDELVACDDGSQDDTIDVLEAFAESAPFAVRVHRNSERLGIAPNFSNAISKCSGSVVALSDQDDVWIPHKLEQQLAVLEDRPAVGAVFSDARVVDRMLCPTGRSMFGDTRFSLRRQRRFNKGSQLDLLLSRSIVCGATLAFRASLRPVLLPIPNSGLHDVWLAVLLAAVTEVVALPEALIDYRQHSANEVGAPATSPIEKLSRRRSRGAFGDEVAHYRAMSERLQSTHLDIASEQKDRAVQALRRKVAHLELRYGPPPGLGAILAELCRGRYHRYSRGFESAAFDLLFRHRVERTRREA